MNRVELIGRLGRDPEMVTGVGVVKFSIATTEKWKDKNGERQERTDWHNCEVWGKLAEVCATYLSKGKQVFIAGTLQHDKIENENGVKYFTKIKVREMEMLGNKSDNEQQHAQAAAPAPVASPIPAPTPNNKTFQGGQWQEPQQPEPMPGDELPF